MTSESTDLHRCKQLIEQQLDWGPAESWSTADFEQLQQQILAKTGISLSASTLRRIWGRADYQHLPSSTTLNTLAQFAGFTDWRHFTRTPSVSAAQSEDALPVRESDGSANPTTGRKWVLLLAGGIFLVLAVVAAFAPNESTVPVVTYQFSSKPLTHSIPNSVIFTYDAQAAPTDSVFIQQSWNPQLRTAVARQGHTHTAIYYEPGFFQAKLLVGTKLVKEHPLLIPTDGWLGTIATKPVPIYLKPEQFLRGSQLHLPLASIQQNHVPLQPDVPLVKFFNVGTFAPVPVRDFSFSCALKNEYSDGSAACQTTFISLITNGVPIGIPLSTKGCVSDLVLMNGTGSVSGKTTDLSAFGVDFSDWVLVSAQTNGANLLIRINNQVAYETPLPAGNLSIVGLLFAFRGTGSVKDIQLRMGNKTVFQ